MEFCQSEEVGTLNTTGDHFGRNDSTLVDLKYNLPYADIPCTPARLTRCPYMSDLHGYESMRSVHRVLYTDERIPADYKFYCT